MPTVARPLKRGDGASAERHRSGTDVPKRKRGGDPAISAPPLCAVSDPDLLPPEAAPESGESPCAENALAGAVQSGANPLRCGFGSFRDGRLGTTDRRFTLRGTEVPLVGDQNRRSAEEARGRDEEVRLLAFHVRKEVARDVSRPPSGPDTDAGRARSMWVGGSWSSDRSRAAVVVRVRRDRRNRV